MPLSNVPRVHCVEEELAEAPKNFETILMGCMKYKLQEPQDQSKEELATLLADHILEDMTCHFTPWQQYRGGGALGMADASRGLKGNRDHGLYPQHRPKELHKRVAMGTTLAYRPSDGTGGAMWGGGYTQLQVSTQAHKVAHPERDSQTTDRVRGIV